MKIPPFHWWRTVFFLIPMISLYSAVLGTLSIASSLADPQGHLAHHCARIWAWLVLATTGVRVTVAGRERLERTTSYVFVANHASFYDIPVIFAALPHQLRIIAKDSLARFPIWGWHLARTNHILVNRKQPGSATLKRVAALMSAGISLIVFAEGTRSLDGTVGAFKGGIFLLAIRAGLPVVPLSLSGTRHVMPKRRLTTCPAAVRLVIHDPIPTTGLTLDDARALAERTRDVVAAAVDVQLPSEPGI